MPASLRLAATACAVIWWAATWTLKGFVVFAHAPIINQDMKNGAKINVVATSSANSVTKLYSQSPMSHRRTMMAMRKTILEILPDAEEVVSYGMPAFKLNGKIVAGLMAAKNHVGYYPFSGSILNLFEKELAKYSKTKSALHVPIDSPLPKTLIKKLLNARLSQCGIKNGQIPKSKYEGKDLYWKSIGLAAPARRGLVDKKLYKLSDLAKLSKSQFQSIHAVGPHAAKIVESEMRRKKLKFKD